MTLSFAGSGVVGGKLPAGTYQLNFVGNGIIANGRAVDVANNGTQVGGVSEFEFTVVALRATTTTTGQWTPATTSSGAGIRPPMAARRATIRGTNFGATRTVLNPGSGAAEGMGLAEGSSAPQETPQVAATLSPAASPAATISVAPAAANPVSKDEQPDSDRLDAGSLFALPRSVAGRRSPASVQSPRAIEQFIARDEAMLAWAVSAGNHHYDAVGLATELNSYTSHDIDTVNWESSDLDNETDAVGVALEELLVCGISRKKTACRASHGRLAFQIRGK